MIETCACGPDSEIVFKIAEEENIYIAIYNRCKECKNQAYMSVAYLSDIDLEQKFLVSVELTRRLKMGTMTQDIPLVLKPKYPEIYIRHDFESNGWMSRSKKEEKLEEGEG